MGAALGGGRRVSSARRRARPISDINVTPMVDVMLVLLIIFMVTAPLLTAGVPIDLPKTNAGALKGEDSPLSVSIDSQENVWLQDTKISSLSELTARLQAIMAARSDNRIFVRGDQGVNYGRVMEVMSALSEAGFDKVALVTQQKEQAAPPTSAPPSQTAPQRQRR